MRDLLVVGIACLAAFLALKGRPWIGVMLWTWISIMNPHRFTYGFAYTAPLAALAAGATLVAFVFSKDRQSPFQGTPVTIFALFAVLMTLSWLMGANVEGDYAQWNKIMKIYFMTFMALMVLKTRFHIMAFAWVTIGSLALLGAKGGLFTVLTGGNYRVWGPPGTFIEDNNEFSLSLVMTIPMLNFLLLQTKNVWGRRGIIALMILCAGASLGSYSRGGLLAICSMGAVLWWRSKNKMMLAILVLFAVVAILPMMPASWWERMNTINEYQQDASAMGRINAWHVAFRVASNHLFGGGMSYQYPEYFLVYGEFETIVRAAHSIYFQILGNHGFIGLFLFLSIWFSTYIYAGWLRRNGRKRPETQWASDLGGMVQVSLVGYMVGGAFLSLAYFDLPYNLMVMVVLARKWIERQGWETEEKIPILEAIGLRKRASVHPVKKKSGRHEVSSREE